MTYSYECSMCGSKFDMVLQNFYSTTSGIPDCPVCKNNYNVSRVWYVPQVIFKGNGWTLKKGELNKNEK